MFLTAVMATVHVDTRAVVVRNLLPSDILYYTVMHAVLLYGKVCMCQLCKFFMLSTQHKVKLLQTAYLHCDWYNEQVNSRTLSFPSNHMFSCLTFCVEVYLAYTIEHYELLNFTNAMILFSFPCYFKGLA